MGLILKMRVYTKISRREASNNWVKYGEELANRNKYEKALEALITQ